MAEKGVGEWVSLGVFSIVIIMAWSQFDLGPESGPPTGASQVEVSSWNWKGSRNGRILAVFGSVVNKSTQEFSDVVLELRIEDEDKNVLARHQINVGNLKANTNKHFREDIPKSGKESMGYIEVKALKK
jgi:hypothetical protein